MGISVENLSPWAQRQVLQKLTAAEARRFDELSAQLRTGYIRNLKLQPQFTLQEAYTTTEGVRVRAIRYQADFSYERLQGLTADGVWTLVVEDVKSRATRTREYLMKKKIMQERFGSTLRKFRGDDRR